MIGVVICVVIIAAEWAIFKCVNKFYEKYQ
jgi:hypothetical protein